MAEVSQVAFQGRESNAYLFDELESVGEDLVGNGEDVGSFLRRGNHGVVWVWVQRAKSRCNARD